jgi:hypothetical protein
MNCSGLVVVGGADSSPLAMSARYEIVSAGDLLDAAKKNLDAIRDGHNSGTVAPFAHFQRVRIVASD